MATKPRRLIALIGLLLIVAAAGVHEGVPSNAAPMLVIVALVVVLTLSTVRMPNPNWEVSIEQAKPKRDSTGPSDIETRARHIEEAKRLPFLDAVFLIHYYNVWVRRWGPPPYLPDIGPTEVFPHFDQDQYLEAQARSSKLMGEATALGKAFFEYSGVQRTYDEQLALFRAENPGFGERSYELAASAGITDMR